MAEATAIRPRLADAAADWAQVAAALLPSLPVRPDASPSPEAHVVSRVCVELLQPLAAMASRWSEGATTNVLGRVEVELRHLESIEAKLGRDLGSTTAAGATRALLRDLAVTSRAPRREAAAPTAWFEVAVDEDEVLLAGDALRSLSEALGRGHGRAGRGPGADEYRFRDGPAVLAFWSMKVETCSPGTTQKLSLRLARRSPRRAITDATSELLARLRDDPGDVASGEHHRTLVALCERSLADLAAP